ncbi:hypothetical protein HDIA_0763 [Hartmannibacter diazotrophicus]|uniref:Uncharacterized protein n=1 Tax=Hartmannibacter diazotrophicus TaxID=1482074 RepID=A0A2C9D240_9HYPH|nr:hypothetical protein [Hartmannibacter diazotrophicus]SON54304.1 hypothetical protein HDIA_0763 [Hartmannibacter diazotrophicus]
MTRFFAHPESDCLFALRDGEDPPTDGLVEEVTPADFFELACRGDADRAVSTLLNAMLQSGRFDGLTFWRWKSGKATISLRREGTSNAFNCSQRLHPNDPPSLQLYAFLRETFRHEFIRNEVVAPHPKSAPAARKSRFEDTI